MIKNKYELNGLCFGLIGYIMWQIGSYLVVEWFSLVNWFVSYIVEWIASAVVSGRLICYNLDTCAVMIVILERRLLDA